jgi:mRNA interferase MazF
MGRIEQYTIYWVTLDSTKGSEIAKTRPYVVASPDDLNDYLNTVIIIPLTSTLRTYPFRVQCEVAEKKGELAVDQIRTVDKNRLNISNHLGKLSNAEIVSLQNILNEMLCQ